MGNIVFSTKHGYVHFSSTLRSWEVVDAENFHFCVGSQRDGKHLLEFFARAFERGRKSVVRADTGLSRTDR